jgi:hypothetical protein
VEVQILSCAQMEKSDQCRALVAFSMRKRGFEMSTRLQREELCDDHWRVRAGSRLRDEIRAVGDGRVRSGDQIRAL